MDKKIIRAALYERVSTDEQEKFGFSIAAQIDNLEEFCQKNDYKIVDHYTDAGVSGGKAALKRPAMARLIQDVQDGKIDIVLFTKLDRWFRNIQEYFKVQEILEKNRVEWKAIHEDYDTTTANGRMAINIYLSVAQNERERGSERVRAVLAHKRKNKEACFGGKTPPLGYKKEKDENGVTRLVIDPETEAAAREFWRICREDASVMSAGKIVNMTFGLNRMYKEWFRAFHNEIYTGEYKGVKDFCPAYIAREEWERLKASRKVKRSTKNRIYLFTGMMLCPECGTVMSSNYKVYHDNVREYYSYRCRHFTVRRCGNSRTVSELKAEKWLLENVKSKLEAFIMQAEVEDQKVNPKPKCDTKRINEKIRRLNVVYMAGGKSDDEYVIEMNDLKRLLAEAEREEKETAPRDLSGLREFLASDFEEIYHSLEREEKRQLWRSIIDTLVVDGNRIVDINFKA